MSSGTAPPLVQPVSSRRALTVWSAALPVYLLAVFHRSSMAVAGLIATDRFRITASQLATFTVLQLFVYAVLQVPIGLLLDRIGPRTTMLVGLTLMTAGQTWFAFADSYGVALAARALVGVGDAAIFVCLLRLVAAWFPPGRVPLLTQLSGVLGQLGAMGAAVPMTISFQHIGWTPTYLISAALGLALGLVLALVVTDDPHRRDRGATTATWRTVRVGLVEAWRHPGTRLGFWIHFTTQFSAVALGLLWGYPYLVRTHQLSPGAAGTLLTVMAAAVMTSGPLLAWLTSAFPGHRSAVAMVSVTTLAATWTIVLLTPAPAPAWLLVALVVVVGATGPVSMIGFDIARTSNPARRLGSASALVNQGGFIAGLLVVLAIGAVLDRASVDAGGGYSAEGFQWAMLAQYPLWLLGLSQIWRLRASAAA